MQTTHHKLRRCSGRKETVSLRKVKTCSEPMGVEDEQNRTKRCIVHKREQLLHTGARDMKKGEQDVQCSQRTEKWGGEREKRGRREGNE